ncbi:MAG: hypothetical protein AABM42_12480 [Actinomycetota bacterium]
MTAAAAIAERANEARMRVGTPAEHISGGAGSLDVRAVELHEAVKRALGSSGPKQPSRGQLDFRPMATVIALRPDTERGREILDQLEQRIHVRPERVVDDGTRRFLLDPNADVDAFNSTLDAIDSDWRSHLTDWRSHLTSWRDN